MCERAARGAWGTVLPKIKTMVNNEVKNMGAKHKCGRAGQRATHVTLDWLSSPHLATLL